MSITCICDTPIDNELVLAECYIHVLYIYALHIMDESCHTCQYNLIYIYIYIYMSITCICDTPIDNELVLPECFHIHIHKYTCT